MFRTKGLLVKDKLNIQILVAWSLKWQKNIYQKLRKSVKCLDNFVLSNWEVSSVLW